MFSLKSVQTSSLFTPNHFHFHEKEFFKKRKLISILSFCNSNNNNNNNPNSDEQNPPPSPQGDSQKQELLVRIAMLQTQKVRLTDYLDERSEYLTQFAEDANAEIDQIGENALKELDEAGERIMGNIDSRMQAFEETMEFNKSEIEENDKIVSDFEGQIEEERNKGLFFKNLGQKKPVVDKQKAKEEADKVKTLAEKNAGSKTRRNIYIALIGIVVVGIGEASISSTFDWKRVAIFGVILLGLISQLIYERIVLSSKTEQVNKKEKE